MRWVIFGCLDGGTYNNLPYVPADLIAGICNRENLNLPAWANKSQSWDMDDLNIRLSLYSVNQDSITDSPSLSATKIHPIACQGLKRKVADFADISFAIKGICISLFGFSKHRKIWISDDCRETLTGNIAAVVVRMYLLKTIVRAHQHIVYYIPTRKTHIHPIFYPQQKQPQFFLQTNTRRLIAMKHF